MTNNNELTDELETIARDEFLRSASDPEFRFAPIARPEESAEATMARIDASAALVFEPCPHCGAMPGEVLTLDGGRPIAVGFAHQPGCPERAED